MIDTSIVRVHQHGACITRNRRQSMGRSRGGLTSKIHALVDTNGLPVRLAVTPGEAHDNRLADRLLSRLSAGSMLLADRGYDARNCGAPLRGVHNICPRFNNSHVSLPKPDNLTKPSGRAACSESQGRCPRRTQHESHRVGAVKTSKKFVPSRPS